MWAATRRPGSGLPSTSTSTTSQAQAAARGALSLYCMLSLYTVRTCQTHRHRPSHSTPRTTARLLWDAMQPCTYYVHVLGVGLGQQHGTCITYHRRFIIYTKSTRAHTHRELIREWRWEPTRSSLGYIYVLGGGGDAAILWPAYAPSLGLTLNPRCL